MTEIQRKDLYDATLHPGVVLLERVIHALTQQGLVRDYHENWGLIPNNEIDTIHYIEDHEAIWSLHIILSGNFCGIRYRGSKQGNPPSPRNAEILYPQITKVLQELGFTVVTVTTGSHPKTRGDNIMYIAIVEAPQA